MVYVDYVILKQSYDEAFWRLKELLDKKEEAFTRTLPSAIRYDSQKVMHSNQDISPLDGYVIDIERIEQQIRQARIAVAERGEMLELKGKELKTSKDIDDKIFYMRFVEKQKVEQIARKLHYSRRESVDYHIRKIRHELEKAKLYALFY